MLDLTGCSHVRDGVLFGADPQGAAPLEGLDRGDLDGLARALHQLLLAEAGDIGLVRWPHEGGANGGDVGSGEGHRESRCGPALSRGDAPHTLLKGVGQLGNSRPTFTCERQSASQSRQPRTRIQL